MYKIGDKLYCIKDISNIEIGDIAHIDFIDNFDDNYSYYIETDSSDGWYTLKELNDCFETIQERRIRFIEEIS